MSRISTVVGQTTSFDAVWQSGYSAARGAFSVARGIRSHYVFSVRSFANRFYAVVFCAVIIAGGDNMAVECAA